MHNAGKEQAAIGLTGKKFQSLVLTKFQIHSSK